MEYYNLSLISGRHSTSGAPTNVEELSLFDIPSPNLFGGVEIGNSSEAPNLGVSRAELTQILTSALSSLRVYVVESDITDAQNSIKAVVEQATF